MPQQGSGLSLHLQENFQITSSAQLPSSLPDRNGITFYAGASFTDTATGQSIVGGNTYYWLGAASMFINTGTTTGAGGDVQSVNGLTGTVTLTTSNINEGTNLYYTLARARSAVSASSPLSYLDSTGVFTISQATTSTNGYLSSTDWNTFNNKQPSSANLTTLSSAGLTGSGDFVRATSPSLITPSLGNANATQLTMNGFTGAKALQSDGSNKIIESSTTATELGYLSGTTSSVQTQLDGKSPLAGNTSLVTVGTVTTGTWNGTAIANAYLANSSITINGSAVSLGSSTTVTASTTNALTVSTGLQLNSGTTFDGSAARTISLNASASNLTNGVSGSGQVVLRDGAVINLATFTSATLGTPTSGTLTNCTGLPISTGVSGLGTGIATFLATPSSANLAAAVTDETGSGSLVFATSPSLTTPTLGVASATSINKVAITAPATSATLTIANGKTLTSNVSTTFSGSDATITLNGNPTLNDWFDQSVKQAATPTFAGLTLNSNGGLMVSTSTNAVVGSFQATGGDTIVRIRNLNSNFWDMRTIGDVLNFRVGDQTYAFVGTGANADFSFNGNVVINTAGKTLKIQDGANSCFGTGATMVAGTVTVNTTAVNTGDFVGLMKTAAGGTATTGNPVVTINNGVSFTITGGASDTSTWSWFIIKAA